MSKIFASLEDLDETVVVPEVEDDGGLPEVDLEVGEDEEVGELETNMLAIM